MGLLPIFYLTEALSWSFSERHPVTWVPFGLFLRKESFRIEFVWARMYIAIHLYRLARHKHHGTSFDGQVAIRQLVVFIAFSEERTHWWVLSHRLCNTGTKISILHNLSKLDAYCPACAGRSTVRL